MANKDLKTLNFGGEDTYILKPDWENVDNKPFVTPQMFGAKGDGVTDDTEAFNNMIQSEYNSFYIPEGVYMIDAGTSIQLKSNSNMHLHNNAILECIPNNLERYAIISIEGCENVSINGGIIIGDREEHTGTSGERGHGVHIKGSKNIIVSDMEISKCWGDAIMISYLNVSNIPIGSNRSENVKILDCYLHHCRRNGLAICGCVNGFVKNVKITDISGTNPQSGIDIEVDYSEYPNEKCVIDSVQVETCTLGISINNAVNDIIIRNSHFEGNSCVYYSKNVVVRNNVFATLSANSHDGYPLTIDNCKMSALNVCGADFDLYLNNCLLENKTDDARQPLMNFILLGGQTTHQANCTFANCIFKQMTNYAILYNTPNNAKYINCEFATVNSNGYFLYSANKLIVQNCYFYCLGETYSYVCRCTGENIYFINNTIDFEKVTTSNNPTLLLKCTKFNAIGNSVINTDSALGGSFIYASYGKNPNGIIANNIIPQYTNMGSFDAGATIKQNNNLMKS